MAAPPPTSLKRNYRRARSMEQFYTGGPFSVSSDAAFLACACGDEVKIVDSSSAEVKGTLEGDSGQITALVLSPDDRILFSAGHSRLIRVWDLASSKCIRSWKGHEGPIMAMACHASGGLLASAGADKRVCVWDVDGGFCSHLFRGHQGVVTSIIFHPDPHRLLLFSGSDDACARIWNLKSKNCVAELNNHFSTVTSLAISEDGETLLTAGRDKVVNLWNLNDYSCKMTIPTNEIIESVSAVSASSCFSVLLRNDLSKRKGGGSQAIYFLTVGEFGIIRIWSSEGAVCLYKQQSGDSVRGFLSAIILPSDQGVFCLTADQQFLFYSTTKTPDEAFQLNLYKRLVGCNEEIADVKFLDMEQYLAVASNLEQVHIYDMATMSCSYVLSGHSEIVVCLDSCISPFGGALMVSGSKDKSVRLWDIQRKECIGIGRGHTGDVGAVAFSKKHRNFFVSGSSDGMMLLWSLDKILESRDLEQALKTKAVIAAHDKNKAINSLSVAPNDSLVCSGSEDRTACIWKLPSLALVISLKGHKRGIWSVEFSPVDQCVLTSSGDKTIKLWAISDGSCLKTFEGHTASVLRASFLTRGTQLVSCGGDGLVKLWTIKTNECIATYDKHEGKVWALAVGNKSEMLATGDSIGVLNIWHDCTAEDKEEAFRREEEAVLRVQELENAVSDSDYTKAIQLAFELRRPYKLFELFSLLLRRKVAEDPIKKVLGALGNEEIRIILEYIREWNTKPKLCHVAQFVLFHIFSLFPPTDLMEIKGISELVEGLVPYSQRHFGRIDRLVRSTYLLDYALSGMSVIEPEAGNSFQVSTLTNAKHEPIFSTKEAISEPNGPPEDVLDHDQQQHEVTIEPGTEKVSTKRKKSEKQGRKSKGDAGSSPWKNEVDAFDGSGEVGKEVIVTPSEMVADDLPPKRKRKKVESNKKALGESSTIVVGA